MSGKIHSQLPKILPKGKERVRFLERPRCSWELCVLSPVVGEQQAVLTGGQALLAGSPAPLTPSHQVRRALSSTCRARLATAVLIPFLFRLVLQGIFLNRYHPNPLQRYEHSELRHQQGQAGHVVR